MATWFVLQKQSSIYNDEEGVSYHYPSSIPNGKQIRPGDYLVCTMTSNEAKDGRRIFGIGRVKEISSEGKHNTAWYGWYKEFNIPYTFEEIGGDPRNNTTNAITRVPEELEDKILNVLLKDVVEDKGLAADEKRLDTLFENHGENNQNWDETTIEAVKEIFAGIFRSQNALKILVPQFGWQGMGNMLGDLGELLAINAYNLRKATAGMRDYDALTSDNKTVQIKTVFASATVGLRGHADLLLVIRVNSDGTWQEIFYGDHALVLRHCSYGSRDNKHSITVSKLLTLARTAE